MGDQLIALCKWLSWDTEDADDTEKETAVTQIVRTRTSIVRRPRSHQVDFIKAIFRGLRAPVNHFKQAERGADESYWIAGSGP